MTTPRRVTPPRGMTTRGKRISALFGLIMLFLLPKHVDCGYPEGHCSKPGFLRLVCTPYEVEPFGFFLLEKALHRDIGFAYTRGETCR